MKRLELNSLASLLLVLFVATAVQGQQSEEPDGFALPEAGVKSVSPAVQVEMELAEHRVLSWPFHVTRIFLADDTLVKLEPMTPSKVRLRALKSGSTRINVWGENGVAQAYDILIHAPITELQKILKEEFSESKITVRQVAASVMLSGEVAEQNARENIESVARQFFPRVINNLKLKIQPEVEPEPVKLQASIFEVSHYDLKQHDLKWPLEASRKGEMQHEVLGSTGAVAEFLQSAYEKKLLRKIATPLITTVEGRRAAFETGGQMPLVIASGSQGGRVRLQQWGVRMNLLPTRLDNGKLRLGVQPKINQIDVAKAIRVESVSLPGIRTHQNDLLVDLGEGESLMLYGMPMERVIREKEDLPLLSDLPLLGESFYKTNKIDDKVELFIIISPTQTPGEKVAASE
ncbi:MAG: pilus assembly protein N-terminal domain-containing protein [Pirellulales bacterium]|nr:pilus assembly protein N-terminal domain-containing protein [Pirellulales bacterium]